jgi:acetoin utilization deacetylase AcuC-like enzyme
MTKRDPTQHPENPQETGRQPGGQSARTEPPPRPPVALLDDTRFDAHAPLRYHPERPERLIAARAAAVRAAEAGIRWDAVPAREASDEELARVHTEEYIERLDRMRGQVAHVDPDTYVVEGSIEAARLAAGGLVALVDAILDEKAEKGLALVRPPGHHARPDQAMGFCLINNVAVAAAHARMRGVAKVAIVDWDVHHGNGTQEMFWTDPQVMYVSTHQYPFYPGTGAVNEIGEGEGRGFTVNVPLSAGGGDAIYHGAFERVILPVLDEFAPELVLVSAGFDPATRDPLAQMEVSATAFGWMARALRQVADTHAQGRAILVLEGGYDLPSLEAGLGAAVRGLVLGDAGPLPATPDHPDLARAVRMAKKAGHKV